MLFFKVHSRLIKHHKLAVVGVIACPTIKRECIKNILPFQFPFDKEIL